MKEILFEIGICLASSAFLMIYHECVRLVVYMICQRSVKCFRTAPWKVWRYIDPIGLILSLTSMVPVSKPYFFHIRDRRTNFYVGIAGIISLLAVLAGSIAVLRIGYGGIDGLNHLVLPHWWNAIVPILVQYLALLSAGMLVANLFPISTFDMGMIVAGVSPAAYLGMIKSDGTVKLIFVLVVLLDMIHYGASRLIVLFL